MSQTDRNKWNLRYRNGAYSSRSHPSALLAEWIDRLPRGRALDVACGAGRNTLFLADNGFDVDAVDISSEAVRAGRRAASPEMNIRWIEHDLDEPLALESGYALILVMRYVNLPLIRQLCTHLMPGGFLISEQHLTTSLPVAGPGNPAYRVAPGALKAAVADLHLHCYEEVTIRDPDQEQVRLARVVAQLPAETQPNVSVNT